MIQSAGLTRVEQLHRARRVFLVTLGLNLLVAASKLSWGLFSNALSMTADGCHSLLDASSNIVGMIGLTLSAKPPDAGHPYGHRKFEALAAMFISFLMFLASYEVLSECVRRLLAPQTEVPVVSIASYVIMFGTMIVNIFVSSYERRQGEMLRSPLLIADSKHTLSDVFATIGVLVSLVAIQLRFPIMDVVASVCIVGVILRAGYGVIINNLGSLVDAAILDVAFIEGLVLSVPGVRGCHKVRSRGMLDSIFIDLHVQVPRNISVEEAHAISGKVEEKLKDASPGVVEVLVHIEDDLDQTSVHDEQ